tara:strand:- start:1038 stop:1397 length:360 start_codon:yes stop_codon:yes gene_type:complete
MKQKPEVVKKGWGHEIVIHNSKSYCGKILVFKKGTEGSAHFHLKKRETWYLVSGKVLITLHIKETGGTNSFYFLPGETITIERGVVHKVTAMEDSEIFEVSTRHKDSDTYRVAKGDSQK